MYREDRQVVNIYTLFAGIAIFISSLGLLSISLFDIRQRYREIGLRKVNGAQAKDIYPLLIKKYLSVMGVATLLSIPLSWIAGFCPQSPFDIRLVCRSSSHNNCHLLVDYY